MIYALVEADTNPNPKGKPGVGRPAKHLTGLYRSEDGGTTWARTATSDVRPFYYSQVRVDPANPDRVYWSSTPVNVSNDGGKTVGPDDRRHSRRSSRDVDRSEVTPITSSWATTAV